MLGKILLIYPPYTLQEVFSELEEVGNSQQPLGLAYLAAVLEKEGYRVKIIDSPTLNYSIDEVIRKTLEYQPDIIGISVLTTTFNRSVILANKLKEFIKVPIIAGGPHATVLPFEVMQHQSFDYVVIGEGELTTLELTKVLASGDLKSLEQIPGIVFRKNGDLIKTTSRPLIQDIDSIPFPARHLLPPLSAYHPTPATYKKLPIGTIMTSRGCPYKCVFCSRAIFGNSCRFRSTENVVQELKILVNDYQAAEIRIWDDTFNSNPQRAIDICEGIVKSKLNISWTCLARLNFARKDVLEAMKKAGCWQISYGIESGNDEILKKIKKGITKEMVRQGIKATKAAGISALGFFIIGLPGETEATMRQTIDFAKELNLDAANFTICMPYPGSEIYDELKASGQAEKINYEKLMVNLPDQLYYVPSGLTEEIVKKYERLAYREFYLRFSFILKQLGKINSWQEFWNKVKAFLAIVGIKTKAKP